MTESGAKPTDELGGSGAATKVGEFRGRAALVTGATRASGWRSPGSWPARGARVAVLDRDPAEAEPGLISVVSGKTDDEAVELAAHGFTRAPEVQL